MLQSIVNPLTWYMRNLILLFTVLISVASFAQSGRQNRPLYQLGSKYNGNGWHFAPGVTYMIPNTEENSQSLLVPGDQGTDSLYYGDFTAKGKLGAYLEFGGQHFVARPVLFHYFDYGVHFKLFRGSEDFEGRAMVDSSMLNVSNQGNFSQGFVGGYFNINHIAQLSDNTFLQFSLGANVDYKVINRFEFEGVAGNIPVINANNLQGQLHAKVGFGFKPESGVMIIPSIETPILNIQPFEDGKSTLPYFNSRYRPIIISVRFLFFAQTKPEDCVGQGTEKRGTELWGKEMRKAKKKKKKR